MEYKKCLTKTNDSVLVLKENKSKFEAKNTNKKTIHKIQVDGCLIDEHQEKCDWLISTTEKPLRAMYIELKGCDIKKAISQLKNTIRLTEATYKDHRRECYAITTRIPKHGTDVRKMQIDFYNETRTTLSVKNLTITVEIQ